MTGRGRIASLVGLALILAALGSSLLLDGRATGRDEASDVADRSVGYDISYEEQQRRIRVEVLNGAGDAGAAALVTERLREAGFDVKTYGNASRFDYENSIVLDRSGRAAAAESVAASLGGIPLQARPDPELHLDATVILGGDWKSLLNRPAR